MCSNQAFNSTANLPLSGYSGVQKNSENGQNMSIRPHLVYKIKTAVPAKFLTSFMFTQSLSLGDGIAAVFHGIEYLMPKLIN